MLALKHNRPVKFYTDEVMRVAPMFTRDHGATYSAGAAILTWVWGAVIPVCLTVDAGETIQARATIGVELILQNSI